MRIIAGKAKRTQLFSPNGNKIRPTGDKIKETLFNMLDPYIEGRVFLDLFAGTGQIGLEALSRGAEKAIFIDMDRDSIQLVRENIKKSRMEEDCVVIQSALPSGIRKASKYEPGIIFMDPPYDRGLYRDLFKEIAALNLSMDALIIAESSLSEDFSFLEDLGFYIEKEKTYKNSKHIFVRKTNE